jgi:hypothetical protein
MEEFVNDGSPSGFSAVNKPSPRYRPGSGAGPFLLHACVAEPPAATRDYFHLPTLPGPTGSNWLYIHPDVSHHPDLTQSGLRLLALDVPEVQPTASGRTVQLLGDGPGWYLKLSYPTLLGRVNRAMPRIKAIAGPEISAEIATRLAASHLPGPLHILEEVGARVITMGGGRSWGQVVRAPHPYGRNTGSMHALVPLFSIFSHDAGNPLDPPLLADLLEVWGDSRTERLVRNLLEPIIECYFGLVRNLGLALELNAQNVLVGLNANGVPVGLVFRDLMGTEKDLTLRRELGLGTEFESSPYKCIDREDDADTYIRRHSVAYDFKVGEYVLRPLVRAAAQHGCWAESELTAHIRAVARAELESLPSDYLPSTHWFRHPRTVNGHEDCFIQEDGPRFR